MAKATIRGNLTLTCGKCKNRFDLLRATMKAEVQRQRDIHCPYCGNIAGQIQ